MWMYAASIELPGPLMVIVGALLAWAWQEDLDRQECRSHLFCQDRLACSLLLRPIAPVARRQPAILAMQWPADTSESNAAMTHISNQAPLCSFLILVSTSKFADKV